jgi:multiple antibiotic resistance protein
MPELALILQLFALLNPLSSFPVLISAYKKHLNVKQIAINASVIALVIAIFILFFGPQLFSLYGISIDSFRIAGGIVLLLLGLDTVREKEKDKKVKQIDTLIAIIATPLLTGPAVISFITIKAYEMGSFEILDEILISFFLVGFVFYLFSLFIPRINEKAIEVLSKIMGLFLTSVAIEMISKGIFGLIALQK